MNRFRSHFINPFFKTSLWTLVALAAFLGGNKWLHADSFGSTEFVPVVAVTEEPKFTPDWTDFLWVRSLNATDTFQVSISFNKDFTQTKAEVTTEEIDNDGTEPSGDEDGPSYNLVSADLALNKSDTTADPADSLGTDPSDTRPIVDGPNLNPTLRSGEYIRIHIPFCERPAEDIGWNYSLKTKLSSLVIKPNPAEPTDDCTLSNDTYYQVYVGSVEKGVEVLMGSELVPDNTGFIAIRTPEGAKLVGYKTNQGVYALNSFMTSEGEVATRYTESRDLLVYFGDVPPLNLPVYPGLGTDSGLTEPGLEVDPDGPGLGVDTGSWGNPRPVDIPGDEGGDITDPDLGDKVLTPGGTSDGNKLGAFGIFGGGCSLDAGAAGLSLDWLVWILAGIGFSLRAFRPFKRK